MNWYSNNKDLWKEIILTISNEINKSPLMIEKDMVQSIFLKKLADSDMPLVFKGGTSLSKAYHVIDRFSEDIDLSVSRKLTQAEKKHAKEIIINTANDSGMSLTNPDEIFSRHDYNKYLFSYDSLVEQRPIEVMVETSYYQTVYPIVLHEIHSLIGDYLNDNNAKLPVNLGTQSFEMPVQSIERTFIDKVFAVCDYRIQDMQERDSRHLYDICKMMPFINMDEQFKTLVDKVRSDRMQSKNNPSAQPEYDIPSMLREIIESRFYENDYKNVTEKLLYEHISYDDAVERGIKSIADSDIFEYRAESHAIVKENMQEMIDAYKEQYADRIGKTNTIVSKVIEQETTKKKDVKTIKPAKQKAEKKTPTHDDKPML